MKKLIALLLVLILTTAMLSGCDRKATEAPAETEQPAVNFAPEATAITSAVETQQPTPEATDEPVADQPVAMDSAVVEATAEPAATDVPVVQPFATATPQPNTAVSSYSQVTNTGLGFKFSYPANWNNIPGRSTVCYVQPIENGTVYPARVAVTMKRRSHKCNDEYLQTELAEYIKLLMTQYDESTFEVSKNLDTETKFMGKKAISTSYLAYDGEQEIQGYVIATYFERYVFCFHFLCAYEDYEAFGPVMRTMRDSVQPEQTEIEED